MVKIASKFEQFDRNSNLIPSKHKRDIQKKVISVLVNLKKLLVFKNKITH